MDHMDDMEKPLKDLITGIYHLPYSERDMEEAYNLGKKVLLESLMEYRRAISDGSRLYDVIDLQLAKEAIEELCDLE